MASNTKTDIISQVRTQVLATYVSQLFDALTQADQNTVEAIKTGVRNQWIEAIKIYFCNETHQPFGRADITIDWSRYTVLGVAPHKVSVGQIAYQHHALLQRVQKLNAAYCHWHIVYTAETNSAEASQVLDLYPKVFPEAYANQRSSKLDLPGLLEGFELDFNLLIENVESAENNPTPTPTLPCRKAGVAKGTFTKVADDFDAPLDVFKEYMP